MDDGMAVQAQSVQCLMFLISILQNFVPSNSLEATSKCGCSGETLIYECTVMGGFGGATVWSGSALNCRSDEIVLLHGRFTDPSGTIRSCNNGATVAKSLFVRDNRYTSQLNITFTKDIAGKTVMCDYDAMGGPNTTNDATVQLVSGSFPPPNKLYIGTADFALKAFTFTWSTVAPDCPAIQYNILASNCGSCPTTTNQTTVTCTDVPTDSTCTFSIQTVVCGIVSGNMSDSISVITNRGSNCSLSVLIAGGMMLFIAVLLILGCLIYEIVKNKGVCSALPNTKQVPSHNSTLSSEEVGNTTYSLYNRGSKRIFDKRHHLGQQEFMDAEKLGNSMAEYSCLDKHTVDMGNDDQLLKIPRQTSSLNKPQSLYSEDVYDRTSHII